jgi:hypothetical protein
MPAVRWIFTTRWCVLLGLLASFEVDAVTTKATVYLKSGDQNSDDFPKFTVKVGIEDMDGIAVGVLHHGVNSSGWDKVKIHGLANTDASTTAMAMGFLEGYLTQPSIFAVSQNNYADWFVNAAKRSPTPVEDWLVQNYDWMKKSASVKRFSAVRSEATYWTQVHFLLSQFQGLMLGYNAAADPEQSLPLNLFLLLNSDGDVESIINLPSIVAKYRSLNQTQFRPKKDLRCSAIFKYDRVAREMYFGHSTWDNFDMGGIRQLKRYVYNLKGYSKVEISMSSTPGFLSSVDDFFLTSLGLAVVETTNGNTNPVLWEKVSIKSVLSWARSMAANILASTTKAWSSTFCMENSGTYNNQWMILDLNKFQTFQNDRAMKYMENDTFRVLEQLPGSCTVGDMTGHIEAEGYWASYNIPFFENVWKSSGFDKLRPKVDYSHSTSARAQIFATRQATVKDLNSLKAILRYNDYTNDPVAHGDPCRAISARCDLNPVTAPNFRLEGGMDAKATTASVAYSNLQFAAQNGPTHDSSLPPFNWSQWVHRFPFPGYEQVPLHVGSPDVFDFDWVDFKPEL